MKLLHAALAALAALVLGAVLLAWLDPALMQTLAEQVRGCF